MTVVKWVVGIAGAVLVTANLYDMVRALVVPRPHTSGPVAVASRVVRNTLQAGVGRVGSFAARDHLLTTLEPAVMLLRLGIWLSAGLAGFALIIWSTGNTSFGHSFIEAGSSIFTLGFATENHPAPEVVAFLAAAFGLLVIALQIAYLPALYDSFNRRETLVTMLESRAGTPAWGPELLARHHLVGIEGNLPVFYGEWERWSADVAESHTTYPALIYMRSPHPTNSWLVGLIAVLDSAALYMAVCPTAAPAEARLCVRMGFTCLRDIARAIRIPFDPDPRPDAGIELPFEDFVAAVARLEQAGVPLERTAEEAWPHFQGWRVNYESTAYTLTNIVFAPPGAWTGGRRYPEGATDATSFPQRPVDRRPDKPEGDRVQSA
ncbi:MAG TPA: hypothetical protein VN791_01505 [Acidimicrobiales bacterium]|nr:hypothetical protein [Acidimicrobiales bacterium]